MALVQDSPVETLLGGRFPFSAGWARELIDPRLFRLRAWQA